MRNKNINGRTFESTYNPNSFSTHTIMVVPWKTRLEVKAEASSTDKVDGAEYHQSNCQKVLIQEINPNVSCWWYNKTPVSSQFLTDTQKRWQHIMVQSSIRSSFRTQKIQGSVIQWLQEPWESNATKSTGIKHRTYSRSTTPYCCCFLEPCHLFSVLWL